MLVQPVSRISYYVIMAEFDFLFLLYVIHFFMFLFILCCVSVVVFVFVYISMFFFLNKYLDLHIFSLNFKHSEGC